MILNKNKYKLQLISKEEKIWKDKLKYFKKYNCLLIITSYQSIVSSILKITLKRSHFN